MSFNLKKKLLHSETYETNSLFTSDDGPWNLSVLTIETFE